MENPLIKNWKHNAIKNKDKNYKFFHWLKSKHSARVDQLAQELHQEAFEKIDCTTCANCCKSSSPVVKKPDIERIAAHLKMKESEFIEKFLLLDEEGDYVMNVRPCPLLGEDNLCSIYEVRPRDCREYPHTDKKNFNTRKHLHTGNTLVCPAVFYIVEEMQKRIR